MYAKKDFSFTTLGKTFIINFPHQNDKKSVLFLIILTDAIKDKYVDYIEDITRTFNSINLFFKSAYDSESVSLNLLEIIDKTPSKLLLKQKNGSCLFVLTKNSQKIFPFFSRAISSILIYI